MNRLAHEMRAVAVNRYYHCRSCSFHGDLVEAIRHVVENQYDARDNP